MMMNKVPYPKHIQTFANQISILKQRGLMIANEQEAEEWLHKVSYIRYWLNIIDPSNTLTQDLAQLFSLYPSVYPGALGFPQSWQQEALWK